MKMCEDNGIGEESDEIELQQEILSCKRFNTWWKSWSEESKVLTTHIQYILLLNLLNDFICP